MITWKAADGRKLEAHEITDAHLKNIIRHCRKYGRPIHVTMFYLGVAAQRQIPLADCQGEPVPWRDPADGKLKTYDAAENLLCYTEVKEH